MNDQQPQQPQFSIAELGAKFGVQLGQANAEIITLGKTISALQAQIQEQAQVEVRLAENNQNLEDELALLKSEIFDHQQAEEAQHIKIAALETREVDRLSAQSAELARQKVAEV